MDMIDVIGMRDDIRYVSVRHEQIAAFMADGFARGSGQIGVCTASRGPGAANMTIGVHNAHAESVPVLALIGQVPDSIAYRDSFEELRLVEFFKPITKWSVEVHITERIAELTQRAVRVAMSGRPGPVMLSLPMDVQHREVEPTYAAHFRPSHPSPNPDDINRAIDMLIEAEHPVIILGGGLQGQSYDENLIALAERLQIPVVATWLRRNVFPNNSPQFCGALGYGAPECTDDLVRRADVVLAMGCRFTEFTTKRWSVPRPDVTMIHVDLDPDVLGRIYVPEIGICADAALTSKALVSALDRIGSATIQECANGRRSRVREAHANFLRETELAVEQSQDGGVSPAEIVAALQQVVTREPVILVQDATSLGPWLHCHLMLDRPGTFFAAGSGSMGWGFPSAMGIQMARPDQRVITISGDGAFSMVGQDLETAVREGLPVINVINNNFSYGNPRDRQRLAHGARYHGVFHGNPDFAAFARLVGAHGERVENASELLPAIDRALASGLPAVIDVIQDRLSGLPTTVAPPTSR